MRTYYLIKPNKKTIEFARIEVEDNLLRHSNGKIGKSSTFNSTRNYGTATNAEIEAEKLLQLYRDKGYIDGTENTTDEEIVFDKAKWHFGGDFPKDLDDFQGYVHTGMFVCWIVERELLNDEFKKDLKEGIAALKSRKISPSTFYADYLDGVFSTDELNYAGISFSKYYFNFDTGQYLQDYSQTLDKENLLPSMYHLEDSWENFNKLKLVIDKRFNEWLNM